MDENFGNTNERRYVYLPNVGNYIPPKRDESSLSKIGKCAIGGMFLGAVADICTDNRLDGGLLTAGLVGGAVLGTFIEAGKMIYKTAELIGHIGIKNAWNQIVNDDFEHEEDLPKNNTFKNKC